MHRHPLVAMGCTSSKATATLTVTSPLASDKPAAFDAKAVAVAAAKGRQGGDAHIRAALAAKRKARKGILADPSVRLDPDFRAPVHAKSAPVRALLRAAVADNLLFADLGDVIDAIVDALEPQPVLTGHVLINQVRSSPLRAALRRRRFACR